MKNSRTKIIFFFSVLFIVIAVGMFAGLSYVITYQVDELSEYLQAQANEQAYSNQLTDLNRVAEMSEVERLQLDEYVLAARENDVIEFIELVETIAKEQGVEVTTQNLNQEEVSAVFENLTMQLQLEGTRSAVLHVMQIFETLPYRSTISNWSLTGSKNEWNAQFGLKVLKYADV